MLIPYDTGQVMLIG